MPRSRRDKHRALAHENRPDLDEAATPEEYLAHLQRRCLLPRLKTKRELTESKVLQESLRLVSKQLADRFHLSPGELEELEASFIDEMRILERKQNGVPIFQDVLKGFADEVKGLLNSAGIETPNGVVFGLLPTKEVNAVTIKAAGGYVVLLNSGLLFLIYDLVEVIPLFFPAEEVREEKGELSHRFNLDIDQILEALYSNKQAHLLFLETLIDCLIFGRPRTSYPKSRAQEYLASLIRDTAVAFVLSHEYAHVLIDDAVSKQPEKKMIGDVEVQRIPRNWSEELAADYGAFMTTLAFFRKRGWDLSLSYLGIDFVFCCMEIAEQALGMPKLLTDPSPNVRRGKLRELLRKDHPDKSAVLPLCGIYQMILAELWRLDQHIYDKFSKIALDA